MFRRGGRPLLSSTSFTVGRVLSSNQGYTAFKFHLETSLSIPGVSESHAVTKRSPCNPCKVGWWQDSICCFHRWHRLMELNHRQVGQSHLYYHYTKPVYGAPGETRTRTPLREPAPQAGVSTDSTTGAYLVPGTGLEPVRCHHQGILSPLCLPVPPPRHKEPCRGSDASP